jgi:hypothetical protein
MPFEYGGPPHRPRAALRELRRDFQRHPIRTTLLGAAHAVWLGSIAVFVALAIGAALVGFGVIDIR